MGMEEEGGGIESESEEKDGLSFLFLISGCLT